MQVLFATFLIETPIYFDWCESGEDQRPKHHKHTCSKEIGLRFKILFTNQHSIMKKFERTYVFV